MQIVVISIFTILSVIFCESSLLASAPKAHDGKKMGGVRPNQALLDKQLIEQVQAKNINSNEVKRLLDAGADANAQCAQGKPALMYAMFDKIYRVPLSSYQLGQEKAYDFAFRENPRIVELLMHHGAECARSNPYLLKKRSNEKEESLLTFIADYLSMGNFAKRSDLIMIATIVGNLYRSAKHDVPTDALNKILYTVVVNARHFTRVNNDQDESIKNNAAWCSAVDAAFFAGANPLQISYEERPADDLILRLKELQNQQCNSVQDALKKVGFPQELVPLTLECIWPNPQCDKRSPSGQAMPHDLRVLCASDSLTDQDIHRIEHYLKQGGNVDVSVSQADLDKPTTVSSVQHNTGAVFDLLDLAFKHDSPELYGMVNHYEHKRIFSVIEKGYSHKEIRAIDFCAVYKMAEEKKCKQIMDFVTVDRMHDAARTCNEQELKKLIEAGANVNARSHGPHAWDLLRVVVCGIGSDTMEQCIRLLLAKGIDIIVYERDDSCDPDESTDNVLGKLIATHRGGVDRIVALLLYVGVRPHYTNKYGRTIYDVLGPDYPRIEAMLKDPDHVERYITPEDCAEFAAIKKEREESLRTMQAKSGAQTAAAPKN